MELLDIRVELLQVATRLLKEAAYQREERHDEDLSVEMEDAARRILRVNLELYLHHQQVTLQEAAADVQIRELLFELDKDDSPA